MEALEFQRQCQCPAPQPVLAGDLEQVNVMVGAGCPAGGPRAGNRVNHDQKVVSAPVKYA